MDVVTHGISTGSDAEGIDVLARHPAIDAFLMNLGGDLDEILWIVDRSRVPILLLYGCLFHNMG